MRISVTAIGLTRGLTDRAAARRCWLGRGLLGRCRPGGGPPPPARGQSRSPSAAQPAAIRARRQNAIVYAACPPPVTAEPTRSATVAPATARPAPSCIDVAATVLASRISPAGMSASPTVVYTVNPVDLVMPLTSASAAISATGADTLMKPSAATTRAVPTVETISTERKPKRRISGGGGGVVPPVPADTKSGEGAPFSRAH